MAGADWYENDELWTMAEPTMFGPDRLAAATFDVDALVSLARLSAGDRVLDLASGTGRHAVELARRGMRVTGVDRTEPYIARARQRAETTGVNVEWVQGDMREFLRPNHFDLVVNLFTSFGYFRDEGDDLKVAQNACASLKPGGAFLLEMAGKEVLARNFQKRDWVECEGTLMLEERTIHPNWDRIEARWIVLRDGKRADFTINIRLYSGRELCALLTDAGFQTVKLFGDLAGRPYDREAKRLVAVAHR